jgi:hypothetical protein
MTRNFFHGTEKNKTIKENTTFLCQKDVKHKFFKYQK